MLSGEVIKSVVKQSSKIYNCRNLDKIHKSHAGMSAVFAVRESIKNNKSIEKFNDLGN